MKMIRKEVIFLLLVAFAGSFLGCASEPMVQKAVPASSVPAVPEASKKYIIQSGDQLDIKFFYNPELNESLIVRPDGMISLQLIDEIQAYGKEPATLDKELTEAYSRELRKPNITVIVRTFANQRVFVGGEVGQEQLLTLQSGLTPLQAVFEAGGFLDTADPSSAIVIRKGPDNKPMPIHIDLTEAMKGQGEAGNFRLQPNDVVYVPKSPIANANTWVDQYITRLLLFRGFSFGFGHTVNDFRF